MKPFTVHRKTKGGSDVTINATTPEDYVRTRDLLDRIDHDDDDDAVDNDREWFANHPKQSYRLRPLAAGELVGPPGCWVLVVRIPEFSARLRIPLPPSVGEMVPKIESMPRKIRDKMFDAWLAKALGKQPPVVKGRRGENE